MITTELFVGLLTYYFVMFMTPGPNNAMLALSGIKFGFRQIMYDDANISNKSNLELSRIDHAEIVKRYKL